MRTSHLAGVLWLAILAVAPGCVDDPAAVRKDDVSQGDYTFTTLTPNVTLAVPRSASTPPNIVISIEDQSGTPEIESSWVDGRRVASGWDSDHDFWVEYDTARSCCYRVRMTYALYQALQRANKPLILYALPVCLPSGGVRWHIIVGASAIQFLSPAADWFLMWQATMQCLQ